MSQQPAQLATPVGTPLATPMARAVADLSRMSAAAILSIPESRPDLLFPGDESSVQGLYRQLAQAWHPDRCRDRQANDVFAHIGALYGQARREIAAGRWRAACGQTALESLDGHPYRLRYAARRRHECGELLIGHQIAAWLVEHSASDLYHAARATLGKLPQASADMSREMASSLPVIRAALDTRQHQVLVMDKGSDQVLLADLLIHLGGRLAPEHVGWILNCLYHIACYLDYAGLTHNAIGPDTVFVSPRQHACALLGGWWYAVPCGGRLVALPQRSADILPPDILRTRCASVRSDLELIRATGRELLGDTSSARARRDGPVPQASGTMAVTASMAEWLQHPTSGCALTDYRQWRELLQELFGRPRFMALNVSFDQVYPLSTAP